MTSRPGAGWRVFGTAPLDVPEDAGADAVMIVARDGFADPPALAVRAEVLAAVGAPEAVRAGGLADLALRLGAAGHPVLRLDVATPARLIVEKMVR